jgi:hypothetical protein
VRGIKARWSFWRVIILGTLGLVVPVVRISGECGGKEGRRHAANVGIKSRWFGGCGEMKAVRHGERPRRRGSFHFLHQSTESIIYFTGQNLPTKQLLPSDTPFSTHMERWKLSPSTKQYHTLSFASSAKGPMSNIVHCVIPNSVR